MPGFRFLAQDGQGASRSPACREQRTRVWTGKGVPVAKIGRYRTVGLEGHSTDPGGTHFYRVGGFFHWLRTLDHHFSIANLTGGARNQGHAPRLIWHDHRRVPALPILRSARERTDSPGISQLSPCPGSERFALPYPHHQAMFGSANPIAPGGG
jgi:hypothetical protein